MFRLKDIRMSKPKDFLGGHDSSFWFYSVNWNSAIHSSELSYTYCTNIYAVIILNVILCSALVLLLLIIAEVLSPKISNFEKLSSYECGFEPVSENRLIFEVQFFIVGILIMLFDLEIAFLLPWATNLGNLGTASFITMLLFLLLFVIGLIYEWKRGALDWI